MTRETAVAGIPTTHGHEKWASCAHYADRNVGVAASKAHSTSEPSSLRRQECRRGRHECPRHAGLSSIWVGNRSPWRQAGKPAPRILAHVGARLDLRRRHTEISLHHFTSWICVLALHYVASASVAPPGLRIPRAGRKSLRISLQAVEDKAR